MPEQMFSTVDNPAQGISAVKALAIAGAEGQKIWTIDQTNLNTALVAINLDADIENEIRSAVNAGKIATAHERPVAFAGTTVTGYLLIDPATGAGAYKISGGQNGGLLVIIAIILLTVALLVIAAGISGLLGLALAGWGLYNFLDFVDDLRDINDPAEFNRLVALTIISQLAAFIPFAALGAEGLSLVIFLEGFLFIWGEVWFG